MDTLKIKTILSAVENKSFSKTAETLSYTPSALSHMADSLEQELGVKLLKRTPKGVELTENGEKLKDKMQAVLDAEDMAGVKFFVFSGLDDQDYDELEMKLR